MDDFRILLYNFPLELMGLRLGLLSRPPFVVDHPPRPVNLVRCLETTRYRMAILGLPGGDVEFECVFPLIRGMGCPSSRCILLVLAPPDRLETVQPYVGRGVNALLPRNASPEELEAEITRLTRAAPRLESRHMVRLKARAPRVPSPMICQTDNISTSGMFLSTTIKVPVGTIIDFELDLPGREWPVLGEARVVRHAQPEQEKRDGMGVMFLTLRGEGRISC
jgi:hypothetical protein